MFANDRGHFFTAYVGYLISLHILVLVCKMLPHPKEASLSNSTESWDDALDFSKWRVPPCKEVISKRLTGNMTRFSMNYFWMFICFLSIYTFTNWRLMVAMAIICTAYNITGVFCRNAAKAAAKDGRIGISSRSENDTSMPTSAKSGLLLFSVFPTYMFSALGSVLLAFGVSVLISSIHAIFRPIDKEFYFVQQVKSRAIREAQQQKLAAMYNPQPECDRFVGLSTGEEEQLTFTTVEVSSSDSADNNIPNTLRNRSSRGDNFQDG